MSYLELLRLLAPEANLTIAALAVLAVDLLGMRSKPLRARLRAGVAVAILGCLAAAAWLVMHPSEPLQSPNPYFLGMFQDGSMVRIVKLALLSMTICTLVLSLSAKFTEHVGEYLALILLANVGMMLLVSSQDLLMVFIALELTSLSLYILAAFNKRNIKSAEAALKYFLFGGMSAAFTLFGISLVYGLAGSTNLPAIAGKLMGPQIVSDPLLFAALVMTLIGFGFKIAAVPFHLWAPDAYEGAPTPSAALIASGSKVASFFILAKLTSQAFLHTGGSAAWRNYASGWEPVLAALAVFSMLLSNLAAIAQSNVKRLLAYSAIAHAGYALTGVLANNDQTLSAVVYYTVTYGFTVLGAFGVVGLIEESSGNSQLSSFAGRCKRQPLVSFCMMIFMLSLAGIPPLAGFFGKFYVFIAAVRGTHPLGLLWLVIVGIGTSAISLYYYLQVLKQIYVAAPPDNAPQFSVPLATKIVLLLLAAAVVVLGCAPNLLLRWLI